MTRDASGSALRRRFERHLSRTGLLRRRRHLLIAVSGGLDSLVLLHVLRFGEQPYRITVAHYDHALRADSARDALWLRGVCRAWEVPLLTARAHILPRNEADARAQRYAYLNDAADAVSADAILTAHHANDQAETVLFRIMRGTGIPGVVGIAQTRERIVRPLLPFLRTELEAYARAQRLRWREDVTNVDVRYARNRIRRDVLPALERVAPGVTRRLAHLAQLAAQEEAAWRRVLADVLRDVVIERHDGGFALARHRILAYHPQIRARALRQVVHALGGRLDRVTTKSATEFLVAGASGTGIALPGGIRLERALDRLLVQSAVMRASDADVALEIRTAEAGAGEFSAGGRRFVARWGPSPLASAGAATVRLDPSSLRFPLTLRAWRPGDRIRLTYGSKKLKKLWLERRVDRASRARTPVLADAAGDIVWVAGHELAHGAGAAGGGDFFEITVGDGGST